MVSFVCSVRILLTQSSRPEIERDRITQTQESEQVLRAFSTNYWQSGRLHTLAKYNMGLERLYQSLKSLKLVFITRLFTDVLKARDLELTAHSTAGRMLEISTCQRGIEPTTPDWRSSALPLHHYPLIIISEHNRLTLHLRSTGPGTARSMRRRLPSTQRKCIILQSGNCQSPQ